MSYAQFGLIQATDFNTLTGGPSSTTANTLNATWATGSGAAGYGQTSEANVVIGDTVAAAKWANLVNKTANAALHQGSSISSVTAPAAGGTVAYLSAIPTNLQTIYTNRLNAISAVPASPFDSVYGSTWTNAITFTHTVSFANVDAARYFFNAGGQIKITASHANSAAGINVMFKELAEEIGTVVISAPSSGTATIAAYTYNGVTKVPGVRPGNTPTIDSTKGYYGLLTSNSTIFTQITDSGPANYTDSFISVIAKTSTAVGPNGDNGNVITLYTIWDEATSNGLVVGTGSTTSIRISYPESANPSTGNIVNTWGTATVALVSITGS